MKEVFVSKNHNFGEGIRKLTCLRREGESKLNRLGVYGGRKDDCSSII